MSNNDDLPGFIEDEPKKPSKPAPAAPAKGFNAFADVPVQLDAAVKPEAAAPTAKAPAKPATGRTAKPAAPAAAAPAKPFDAFADAASTPDGNDADVRPGTGKDLWACPHCGTKNKPDRTSCRSCGKKPTDEVIIPWHANPIVKPAIGAGVVLVIVLLGWLLFSGGVRFVEPEVGNIDGSRARTGSGQGKAEEFEGQLFTPSKRYGVCGRLVGMIGKGSLTMMVLAVGADGKDETRVAEAGVDFSAADPVTTPELHVVTVLCFGNVPASSKGQIVSLFGDVGTLAGTDGQVVRIEKSAVR